MAGYDGASIDGAMNPKDAKPEAQPQRRYRRRDVSLRARFSADGNQYHLGVVTSIGADGAFVQTDVLYSMNSRLVVEIPLGRELGEVRAVAKIVYLNRRSGTEVLHGFGMQLIDPPDDLRQRIERFIDDYSSAVALTREGQLAWPFANESAAPGEDTRPLKWIEADATGEAWRNSI